MFTGSYVAMLTPFDQGEIDETALRKMVNWQIDQGTRGLVPMGTTGESPAVSMSEQKRVIEIVVEETRGRIPVIAGAGSNNPVEALELARFAEKIGADGVLCVAGYYNKPSQEGLFEHFRYLHDRTSIPIIIYNIPPRCVVDVQPNTMARLAALPRVVGVKDATMDLARIGHERMVIDKPFSYFSGEDMTAVAYNAMGGTGCISVTANVCPALCAKMQAACLAGDYAQALTIHDLLAPVHHALFAEPNPAGVKFAAAQLGLCSDEVRLPMLPISQQNRTDIIALLDALTAQAESLCLV